MHTSEGRAVFAVGGVTAAAAAYREGTGHLASKATDEALKATVQRAVEKQQAAAAAGRLTEQRSADSWAGKEAHNVTGTEKAIIFSLTGTWRIGLVPRRVYEVVRRCCTACLLQHEKESEERARMRQRFDRWRLSTLPKAEKLKL